MSEICKELICLATRCRATRPRQMSDDLLQEIINSLYQASTWIGISELSHREDRAMIQELRRRIGDDNGQIAPPNCRGYSSPNKRVRQNGWDELGRVKMEA